MRLPRQLFIIAGSAAIIASIAAAGLSFGVLDSPAEAVGDFTPTPDPTIDPCADTVAQFEGDSQIGMFSGADPCTTPTEQGPAKTHTPTPQGTTVPTEAPEVTNTVQAPTTAPATNTPTGGAGAGGVTPPNTGSGGDASTQNQWLIAAGSVLLLAGGAGSLAYGLRRR